METEASASFICPSCLQENEVVVDLTAGGKQTFVEDCTVCCRPMTLFISVEQESGTMTVRAEPES